MFLILIYYLNRIEYIFFLSAMLSSTKFMVSRGLKKFIIDTDYVELYRNLREKLYSNYSTHLSNVSIVHHDSSSYELIVEARM